VKKIIARGAEAIIHLEEGEIVKTRIPKKYRLPELDQRIRQERTRAEVKLMVEARRHGIPTPIIRDIDRFEIRMEYIQGTPLKEEINPELAHQVGELVGRLHQAGIIHGDLTTSNLIKSNKRIYLIDFGLAYFDKTLEAQGVDVHVFFQTLNSSHKNPEKLIESFKTGYRQTYPRAELVLARVKEIEKRGRYA